MSRELSAIASAVVVCFSAFASAQDPGPYVRYQEPGFFSYDELVALGQSGPLAPELNAKLEKLTSTPFVNNEAYYRGATPHRPVTHHMGPSLRTVMWNIERGVHLEDIILMFTDREGFIRKVATERMGLTRDEELPPELEAELAVDAGQNYAQLRAQIAMMQSADVLILNEVDWGMPRSAYREVAKELGEALDMNWAWGLEFVEVDAKVLGIETFDNVTNQARREELIEATLPDKARLKAFHGSAILSRYPIRSAELIPFTEGYDWFSGEESLPIPEKIVRGLAGVFGDPLYREMRRGDRMALYAELDVPELPKGRLTVVTPHLENRAKPNVRQAQMRQVLEHIRGLEHPVVVAGDLNTTGGDYSPRSFTNIAQTLFLSQDMTPELAALFLTPFGGAYSALHFGTQISHNQADPTVHSIPILAPNYEQGLFTMIQDFRFDDGTAFDLRGDAVRTHDGVHSGKLANSNDRADKGFAPTFDTGTMGFLGQFKLDWVFVKSYVTDPFGADETYRFAPHGAWVMRLLNVAPVERLSDHYPMVVTLPFEEPIIDADAPDVERARERRMPRNMPAWARDQQRRLEAERELERARANAQRTTDLSAIALGDYSCGDYLALLDESPSIAGVRDIWALGFHYGESGLDETWPTLSYDKVVRFTERLQTLCERSPEERWFDIVRGLPPERARGATTTFFDLRPGQYTCQQHLDLAASESHLADNRAVFAHGYDAVHRGLGDRPVPITASALYAFAQSILARCRTSPDDLWIRVVRHDDVHTRAVRLGLSWDEIANASYTGLLEGPVVLDGGAHDSGGTRVELVPDFRIPSFLIGEGDEAVVLLTEHVEGASERIYLAVVADVDGTATNLLTALVGDRVQIVDGRMGDEGIALDVLQAGAEDPICCPSQKLTRIWSLSETRLREREPILMGTLSLRDLEGVDWVLTHFDPNDPAPEAPTVTLSVDGAQVTGSGGCNRYFAELTEGDTPGAVQVGAIGATRMACPGAVEAIETRFLRQLESVTRFGFRDGKLVLTATDGGATRTMLFSREE